MLGEQEEEVEQGEEMSEEEDEEDKETLDDVEEVKLGGIDVAQEEEAKNLVMHLWGMHLVYFVAQKLEGTLTMHHGQCRM